MARGAGHPDVPPPTLRRFRQAVASAYELDEEPDEAKLAELSEAWRQYRAWVTYLLRVGAARVRAVLRLWRNW